MTIDGHFMKLVSDLSSSLSSRFSPPLFSSSWQTLHMSISFQLLFHMHPSLSPSTSTALLTTPAMPPTPQKRLSAIGLLACARGYREALGNSATHREHQHSLTVWRPDFTVPQVVSASVLLILLFFARVNINVRVCL